MEETNEATPVDQAGRRLDRSHGRLLRWRRKRGEPIASVS